MTDLAAAALAVLCSVSRRTLFKRTSGYVYVDRRAMMRLAKAFEAQYPGLLAQTFDRIERGEM